jgi:Uma2 family endonuclease
MSVVRGSRGIRSMATGIGLTIEDFERLPQEAAHNRELVDGELIDGSGNTAKHNDARDFLGRRLGDFAEQHHLGMV